MDLFSFHRQSSRFYILVLNVLTLFGSLILFGAGIYGLASNTRVLLESTFVSWTLVIMGVVILLVSLLGATAGLSDSKRIVGAYGVMLAVLAVFQFGILIYGLSWHDQVDALMDSAWQAAYESDPRSLQDIETRLQCCGFAAVDDRAIPKDSKNACARSPAFGYKVACKKQLLDAYSYHESAILGVISVIEILQILALIATLILLKRIPSDDALEFGRRSDHSRALLRGMRDEDQGLLQDQGQQQSSAYDEDSRYGTVTAQR